MGAFSSEAKNDQSGTLSPPGQLVKTTGLEE